MEDELKPFAMGYPDSEEAKGGKTFLPIPEGVYWVDVAQVRFKQHARGPMFGIMCKVKEDPLNNKHMGRTVWGNIIFLPYYSDAAKTKVTPGSGIARTFLKAIGENYKGEKINVNPKNWVGKSLGLRIKHNKGKEDVKEFMSVEDYRKSVSAPAAESLPEESIF